MSHSGDSGDNAIVEHILTAKGRVAVPNRMKGRGGSFSIQKYMLQILNLYIGFFADVFRK